MWFHGRDLEVLAWLGCCVLDCCRTVLRGLVVVAEGQKGLFWGISRV